jgi:hypothetical protein
MDRAKQSLGSPSDLLPATLFLGFGLLVLPASTSLIAAAISGGREHWKTHLCRFGIAMAPLGFGMWIAHFVFHFFTAALTPLPVLGRVLHNAGLTGDSQRWTAPSLAFYDLPALEILFLNAGYLLCLWMLWKIAQNLTTSSALRAFVPWGSLASALYLFGLWIIFQPMEMRGTLMP